MNEKPQRPNFLVFITDQQRADHVGCYGNRLVQTPHIDSLAARGTRYDKFYVSTPICMPNRSTLMTGRVPSLHGVRQNGQALSLKATTFTHLLSAAGWKTALFGKSHLQNITNAAIKDGLPKPDPTKQQPPLELGEARIGHGLDGRYDQETGELWRADDNFDIDLPFYGFETARLVIGHGDNAHGHYARFLEKQHPGSQSLRGAANALPSKYKYAVPQAWKTAIPEELYPTNWVADETIDYLHNHVKSNSDKPFFIQCSFPDPHHPFTPPGKYFDMYNPDDIPTPSTFFHPTEKMMPHLKALLQERDIGQTPKSGPTVFGATERWVKEAIALTYGSIALIDDAIGRVLASLSSLGLDNNTVIIFMSDHGDFMGDHQLLFKGALHYQGILRTPFIWVDPQRAPDRPVCDALCGTIDVPTTILERAGVAPFNGMQGGNLVDYARNNAANESLLIEDDVRKKYMGFPSNFRVRSLITKQHRLTLYSNTQWGELYDLATDPNEFENLWESADHASLRASLTEQLAYKMMQMADSSPLSTGHGP